MDIDALLDPNVQPQDENIPPATTTPMLEAEDMREEEETDTSTSTTTIPVIPLAATSEVDGLTVVTTVTESVDTRFFPALNLREVLAVILAHSDNNTTARAARVNSHWSEVALDTLYRRSPELFDLVSILAPISETFFSRELLPSDWARFAHYAPRVHTLSHDTTGSHSSRHLSESLFQELGLSRPSLLILPNLHTLSWTVSRPRFLRAALLFFHPNVPLKSLTLRITRTDGAKTFESFLQFLADRVPHLETFSLDIPRPAGEYIIPFTAFLSKLRALTSITLPHFFLTAAVLCALAPLGHLESIVLRKADHIGTSADLVDPPITIPPSSEHFQSIRHLSIDCNLSILSSLISPASPKPNIKSLHISSISLESPAAIYTFLSSLPMGAPNLESLMLALLTLSVPSPPHSTEITFSTISPITALKQLEAFGITYNYPVAFSPMDVEELARSLPNIKKFYLCESSYDTHDRSATTLGLESLISFAKHCTKIEELGLFLDAGVPSPPPNIPDGVRFTKLHTLSVGQSFLPAVSTSSTSFSSGLSPSSTTLTTTTTTAVALFLSKLLPPLPLKPLNSQGDEGSSPESTPTPSFDLLTGCTALPHSFSPTYHEASPHPESDDIFQERLNSWSEIRRITGVLLEVAREVAEREREQNMEKEKEEQERQREREKLDSNFSDVKVEEESEIQRLRAEISRLQLEVEGLRKMSMASAS